MTSLEKISPGDWIRIGRDQPIDAVVCSFRPKRIEVVYLSALNKALHRDVVWRRGGWEFADLKSAGKPADKEARLHDFVKILRRGKLNR